MRVSLIIPALNEQDCLGPLLAELPAGLADEVIVVDNGSTDGTADAARRGGARVVSEPRRGYGYACAAGIAAAGGDALAFMDGDGSFVPAELGRLTAPILAGEADLAVGSRFLDGRAPDGMPHHQAFGNRLSAWLLRRLYRLPLTDLGPYRAARRDLMQALDMRELTYGWTIEMVVKAARRGARIVEAPVTYRPRLAGQSKISGTLRGTLLAAWRILSTTLRYAR
jgi:glycosyltransferase involved in cell wall biosynthesis